MHRFRTAALVFALAGMFMLGGFILPDRTARTGPRLFQEVFTLVSNRYVDSLDTALLYEKAARGLLAELEDPYAVLYSPEELERFTIQHEGKYAGVGMLVEERDGAAMVRRVYPNTPAERAGLMPGDFILSLDGESVAGWPLDQVAGGLKGEPGTVVEVEIGRPGVDEAFQVRLTRAVIHIPAVPFTMLVDGGVGYVPLLQFNETSAEETAVAVAELLDRGASGIVLDLRGNGGGIVDQAIDIAGIFLPRGTAVAEQRERGLERIYVTHTVPVAPDVPLVVLVDQETASASEIVAGALQDHDRAVVIGQRTFGKGLVQSAYRLADGYILKMTTGKWYTPIGRSIHREREIVDGYLVETAEGDTAERPVFQSAAGRTIYGGGGIVPDLDVHPDTLDAAEQALVRAFAPQSQVVYGTLFDYAVELKSSVTPGFQVRPEWREEYYRRLVARGVDLDRAVFDAASSFVDRLLEDRVARLAFGDAEAKRRGLRDDAPLRKAIELLREGRDQHEIFARAAAVAARG